MTSTKTLARLLLAGPVALTAALVAMAAMPLWLPSGAAGIDNLVLPILLFPVIWAFTFFYAVLEESLIRAGVAFTLVIAANGLLASFAVMGV